MLLSGPAGRVAIERKFTETDFGTGSRPRLRPADPSYAPQHCNGAYRIQAGRSTRCSLTEIGARYWERLPDLFARPGDRDHTPCSFGPDYQLARNALAAAQTPNGAFNPGGGHALVLYDARNPAFQAGGSADAQWEAAQSACLVPGLLRRLTWQRFAERIAAAPELMWLTESLKEKYSFYRTPSLFLRYLEARGIPVVDVPASTSADSDIEAADACERAARGRYKGNAIGNAQNLLVRNILSRLGDEQFSEADWRRQIEAFGNRCAYCGADGELLMDHVIPINKQALGEHRIGNLVPSCQPCNAKKGARDFREFLSHAPNRIAAIETHMSKHDYTPLGDSEAVRQIAELAHQDVRQLADRYVAIINTVLRKDRGDS